MFSFANLSGQEGENLSVENFLLFPLNWKVACCVPSCPLAASSEEGDYKALKNKTFLELPPCPQQSSHYSQSKKNSRHSASHPLYLAWCVSPRKLGAAVPELTGHPRQKTKLSKAEPSPATGRGTGYVSVWVGVSSCTNLLRFSFPKK